MPIVAAGVRPYDGSAWPSHLCQNAQMRMFSVLFLVVTAVACGGLEEAAVTPTVADHAAALRAKWSQGQVEVGPELHRLRNLEAMLELVEALPPDQRPQTILYLASGDHLAPLGLCDLLPDGVPCRLVMTEVDGGVQEGIADALTELQSAGCLKAFESGPEIAGRAGTRRWTGKLGSRPFSIELRISDPELAAPLMMPEILEEADLVISHDWSGEPLGNLQVIDEFLQAARKNSALPPPLMIEDLQAHPYETDLRPFSPIAVSAENYGHRASDAGPGRHGRVELGTPIFGGAVLLSFADAWWRELSVEQLSSVFDFLLLNQFDIDRQNVLEGGSDPLLAPALLDWWTGYGARGIDGKAITPGPGGTRQRMIEAAIAARDAAGPEVSEVFARRLGLYRELLALRAQGIDTLDLMPAARYQRRPSPGHFPSDEMEQLFRQALRRIGVMRAEREAFAEEAKTLLNILPNGSVPDATDVDELREAILERHPHSGE